MKIVCLNRWGFATGMIVCSMLAAIGAEVPVRGQYRVIDLGRLSGFRSEARGINARGDIAGLTTTDIGYQAARWRWDTTNYVIQALGKGEGYGIADDGTVAGLGDSTGGTLWPPGGGATSLGLDKGVNAISASGTPVGWISFTVTNPNPPFNVKFPKHAAWYAGGWIDLAQRPEWDCAVAGVDRAGIRWVGSVFTNVFASGATHAWLFPGRDLHTLTNFATSFALAVNSSTHVVGRVNSGPFSQPMFWSEATGMRLLNTPGGTPYGSALGINDAGQAVGALGSGAVLWSNVGRTNETNVFLGDLLPPGSGWTLQAAYSINNRGEIVGYGLSPTGGVNGFCLVPTNIVTRTIAGSATAYGHGQAWLNEGLTTNRLERVRVELLVTELMGGSRVVTNAFADAAGEFAFSVREPAEAVFAVRLTLEDADGWVSLRHAGVSAAAAVWARSPDFTASGNTRADLVWRINEAASPTDPNMATAYLNGQPFRVDGPGATGAAGAGHDEFAALAVMYRNFQLAARFARDELGVTPQRVIVNAFADRGTYWQPATPPRIWIPTANSWYHSTFQGGHIRGGNRPGNREFHEYGHHLMSMSALGMNAFNSVPNGQSHWGLRSYTSAGSWVEGFAEFIGAVTADRMLTADERGRAGVYPCYSARLDLERPYRLSQRSVYFPAEATNITFREEFVVAALLWDFYDAPASDPPDAEVNELTLDPLHLPLRTLFETITAPAVTDVKELYAALRAYAVAHPAELVPGFVDVRFESAGIYDDRTFAGFDERNTNGVFNAGETVGITSWNPNYPQRHDASLPPSALLQVAVADDTGTPVNSVLFESRSISPPPWDRSEITNALTLPGAGPWFVPVVPPPASTAMVVRVSRPGFRAAPELRLETAWFNQRQNEAGPDEILMEHNFTLARAALRAARRADGMFEISWPADLGDVVLEGATTFPATVWTPISTPPTTVDGEHRVTFAPADAARFFRLRAP